MKSIQKNIPCLLFFLFVLFVFDAARAQRFRAGFAAGPVIAEINGARARVCLNKLGFTLGGIVNSALNEKNTLQLEINYIQKGTLQRPDSNNNGHFKISLDYIEIPLLLKHRTHFSIAKKTVDKFDLEIGASFGRLVRVKELLDNSPLSSSPKFNKTDVSVFAGLDYNIVPSVYLCLRYSNSVIPVLNKSFLPAYLFRYSYNKGNNMVFQFAFKFVFGKTDEKAEATE